MTKQAVYIPDQSWYLHLAKFKVVLVCLGFPGSSAGKESTCNAGDQGSIPGLSRSPGEGIGYLLQYSWASLVVQMVKNPPAVWEAWVWSLGLKDPLEGRAWQPPLVFLPEEFPWTEEPGRLQSMRLQRVGHNWVTKHIGTFMGFCITPSSCFSLEKWSSFKVHMSRTLSNLHQKTHLFVVSEAINDLQGLYEQACKTWGCPIPICKQWSCEESLHLTFG